MDALLQRLRRLPADTIAALGFFSRLPVSAPVFDIGRSAAAWPLAGLLLAAVPGAILAAGSWLHLPPLVAAGLSVATAVALTGGLHEDGLADTADGFGGGRTRERKLAIMRDSRLGTYGGIALVLALLLRTAALSALLVHPPRAVAALLAGAAISRVLAIWHWHATEPARSDGLARMAGKPDATALAISLGLGGAAALLIAPVVGISVAFAVAAAALSVVAFSTQCRRQIDGHTGDTIGAAQQIAELVFLVALSAAGPHVGPPMPI